MHAVSAILRRPLRRRLARNVGCQIQVTYTFIRKLAQAKFLLRPEPFNGGVGGVTPQGAHEPGRAEAAGSARAF